MLTFLKRAWVLVVVVVAVALGGLAVDRLRGVFGSDKIFSATGSSAEPLVPSHIKQVTYEVYGPSDTTGSVSYLNNNAKPEQANFTSLPWTYTITTTVPAVIANVVAQGNSDKIGCRITVNGEIKDEQTSAGHHAQTFCLVKAA
jgi:Mycobacterium membrane protein